VRTVNEIFAKLHGLIARERAAIATLSGVSR
jgi:hypothetical protein